MPHAFATAHRQGGRFNRSTRLNPAAKYGCEALEQRVLLATIDWINRGPADDLDLFGVNENVARSIVDRAIADWERVIVDFNYGDAANTFDLTVLGFPGFPGQTVNIAPDVDGKPRSAMSCTGVEWKWLTGNRPPSNIAHSCQRRLIESMPTPKKKLCASAVASLTPSRHIVRRYCVDRSDESIIPTPRVC